MIRLSLKLIIDTNQSPFYTAFMVYTRKGNLPAIFNTQDENLHKQLKSPIASLYSLTNVVNFEKSIDEVMDILFEQLDKRFVSSRAVFDLADWLQYFAFEVMGTMTFSSRYGFLESGQDINGMLDAIWNFMLTVGPVSSLYRQLLFVNVGTVMATNLNLSDR